MTSQFSLDAHTAYIALLHGCCHKPLCRIVSDLIIMPSWQRAYQYGTSLICSRLRKALFALTMALGVLSRLYMNMMGGPFMPAEHEKHNGNRREHNTQRLVTNLHCNCGQAWAQPKQVVLEPTPLILSV